MHDPNRNPGTVRAESGVDVQDAGECVKEQSQYTPSNIEYQRQVLHLHALGPRPIGEL